MGLNCCKEVVDAVFVIPFTAGRLFKSESGNKQSEREEKVHDGSISGIIILTSILVVTFVVLFGIASFEHPTDKTFAGFSVGSKQVYLTICFLIAAATCIVFMIVHRLRNSIANALTQDRFFLRIKLSFLWIFTSITVFYSAVKIIKAITCYSNVTTSHQIRCKNSTAASPENDSVIVMYKIVQILFCIVQSTFVHRFINYNFCVSWKIYYSLLLIFLANISQWTQFFVDVYVMEGVAATPCFADNKTSIDNKCYAATVFEAVRPYCHPIELEYSLLSMLFLAELWPSAAQNKSSNDELISVQESQSIESRSISTGDDTSQAPTNSISNEENSNDIELLMPEKTFDSFSSYPVICILQFDNYEKVGSDRGNKFVMMTHSIFLLIATLNLCFWVGDSIFEATSYDNNVLQVVYDRGAEKLITHFLFPFLVFFRFESFICFYGIYRKKQSYD
ncbi:unnamed protein product [Mytilus coruscus]|uniref:Uncharacterized protein n=1 Tax=Mytilus coruscus TaxID=42192 RepID=A0A6J8DGV3_MYTCO|nr:unnamed protein product [Mytilus coruscus]